MFQKTLIHSMAFVPSISDKYYGSCRLLTAKKRCQLTVRSCNGEVGNRNSESSRGKCHFHFQTC